MGLSSSLNAGVMGLAVNATKLATISDNIANSETYGYKRADTDFTNMVLRQGAGAYTAGGVRVATFKDIASQGALVTTANSTDISIAGRGMLPVTTSAGLTAQSGDRPLLLTTTGSFSPDQNGYLRTLSGNFLMGWPAEIDGTVNVPGRNSSTGLEPVQIVGNQFIASPTSNVELGLNIPASATQAGADGASFDLPVEYFDSLGRSQTLSFEFIPSVPATGASNTWTVEVTDQAGDPTTPIASFDVVFDDATGSGGSILSVTPGGGATYDSTTGIVNVNVSSGPISVAIGAPGESGLLTQLSSSFAPVGVRADGAPIGSLNAIEINEQGMLEAIYDTGFRRVIYQIPLADVPNVNGLSALDNQTYSVSQASGDFYFWDAGSGPVGSTIGFSLTESTTDIAEELTDLIQTQRAYSSNAKIIQTVDEMLQETTNLIR
ncbi:MAG: flagellar hook-basal body complex protein [Marinicaulis sp.]|nr:flagellar hook-basal body complex protein [Marinicaulis sp.]NNE41825.1 flagellar hook-basal body complex protein [Marinicaulis sp.]NNL90321.1 flagellar hook-basal body complex protein [Marinicaulis sp.]